MSQDGSGSVTDELAPESGAAEAEALVGVDTEAVEGGKEDLVKRENMSPKRLPAVGKDDADADADDGFGVEAEGVA